MIKILALLITMVSPFLRATTVTGTIRRQGVPFTGYFDIALSYPGTTGSALALPGVDPNGHMSIVNGALPTLTLDGNDTIRPRGSYYQFTYYDAYASPVARLNYVITGDTFDVGAAVPTPITPANISYLDLMGIRNFSAQSATFSQSIRIGNSGTLFSATGITNAKVIGDVRYAAAYASQTTSSSCGVNEAIADLPSTGGTVILQAGTCTQTSPIMITKPLTIRGSGQGGGGPSSGTLPSPSVLVNGQLSSSSIIISPGVIGVTLSDFAILGNSTVPGATSGAGILVNGGSASSPTPGEITLSDLLIYGAKGPGIDVEGGETNLYLYSVSSLNNGGFGLYLSAPSASYPVPFVSISSSRFDSNTTGIAVAGPGVQAVNITSSSLRFNSISGANVASGSTSATVRINSSILTGNTINGVRFSDGYGHLVADSTVRRGVTQQYGVYADFPTLDAYTVQLTLRGNDLQTNVTADLFEGASTSYILVYPQAQAVTSPSFVTVLNAPAAIHYILPAFISTATTFSWHFTGCSQTTGQPTGCTVTAHLPQAMPDANYDLVCQAESNDTSYQSVSVQTARPFPFASGASIVLGITKVLQNGAGASAPNVSCIANHN